MDATANFLRNMDTEIIDDDSAPDQVREEAFQNAKVQWKSRELLPFSMAKKSYFLSWRAAMGAPALITLFQSDALGFLGDALRLVFLCSRTPEELESLRYDLRKMQAACDEWTDANVAEGEENEIVTAGLRLWNGTSVTQHAVQVDPDTRPSLGK